MSDIIFHIGLHKTGSTFFQKEVFSKINCSNFNYINLSNIYSDIIRDLIYKDNIYFDKNKYVTYFNNKINLISCENLSGNSEGISFNLKNIIDNIYTLDKNSKIILFIRRQDTFAQSNYVQSIRSGSNLSIKNMYKYIFNESLEARHYQIIYKDLFLYKNYINYIVSLFGKKNVLIIPFEEFKENNKLVVQKVLDFCNLKISLNKINFKIVNSKIGVFRLFLLRFFNLFFSSYHNPYGFLKIPVIYKKKLRLIPLAYVFNYLDRYSFFLNKIDPPYRDKTGTCKKILEMCKEDNKKLDKKYKLGLKKYGYY